MRPRERAAAERADCPLWAAMARAAGGEPVAAGELAEWEACRREALAGDRDPTAVAADFDARAVEYKSRWTPRIAFSVAGVFRNWTKLAPPPVPASPAAPSPERAEWLAEQRERRQRQAAERGALLAALGTSEEAQALWQEDCRRPPRLGLVWAAAIFVPPRDGDEAALVFAEPGDRARARASPVDYRAATARVHQRHRGYAGVVHLLTVADFEATTGGGDDGRAGDLADQAAGAAAGAGPGT